MPLRFTSKKGQPERHFCSDCADDQQEVQEEIEQASEKDALEISYDLVDEVCAFCGRRIATVPARPGVYYMEMEVTFRVKIAFPDDSALAAEYNLGTEMESITFEDAEEKIEAALRDGVRDVDIMAIDVHCEGEECNEAKLVPPEKGLVPVPEHVFPRLVSPTQERFAGL